jgi:hypothetical protein
MEFRILTYRLAFFLSLVTLLQSCSKEVFIELDGHEDRLVIDGRIETGLPPVVILSISQDLYASTDVNALLNSFVSGATVSVSDGTQSVVLDEICANNVPPGLEEVFAAFFGVDPSELAGLDICLYSTANTAIFGEVGKSYTLTVVYDGVTYEGSTSLQPPHYFDSLYWKEDLNVLDNGLSWVTFTDPAGQRDFYFWECRRINLNADGEPLDAFFRPTFNPAFDDTFFDGLTFDFAYENPHNFNTETPFEERGFFQRGDTVVIKFSKLDEVSYQFLERKHIQMQNGGPNPFAAPINIPSNMSNGALGGFIGYSPIFDTLICQ